MDSDKARSVSYQGYGGHVASRFAGYQNRLYLWILMAFCRFCNADDELGGCIRFPEQPLRLPRILSRHQARQPQCVQDLQPTCIFMNMRCSFYGNHLAMFSTWRLKTFSPPFALLWALMNEALVARALHAACRARSECRLSRAIFHSHRTNAPGSRSQSKRSGIELELRTLRDRAHRAIDPPTARAIVGYRATSSILVIHDPDLSERIDTVLQNSISICLPVHSIFVLRIVEKLSEFFNENWPSSRARRKNNQIKLLLVHV